MAGKRHNPEKRAWRGRSYKKGGERTVELKASLVEARDSGSAALQVGDPVDVVNAIGGVIDGGRRVASVTARTIVLDDGSKWIRKDNAGTEGRHYPWGTAFYAGFKWPFIRAKKA